MYKSWICLSKYVTYGEFKIKNVVILNVLKNDIFSFIIFKIVS